ncbi:MAG: helix-turn-helix transcriptional regulator [Chloroflexi bacterium]|nr:helix-turn-helix transcriptional regulator [Chloroflexota bacterium]
MAKGKRSRIAVAGDLESTRLAATLGLGVKDARERLHLTQHSLARRIGLSQARISALERGLGGATPLETWVAIGIALQRPLAVSFTRPLMEPPGPSDAGHLDMQEGLLQLLAAHGRTVRVELPTRPTNPSHSADVAIRTRDGRYLFVEAWNRFGDLGAAFRSTDRKAADLAGLAEDGEVRTAWVIWATASNRALLRRYPGLFQSRFSGSSRAWARALRDGTPPPRDPGIMWWDRVGPVEVRWPHRTGET